MMTTLDVIDSRNATVHREGENPFRLTDGMIYHPKVGEEVAMTLRGRPIENVLFGANGKETLIKKLMSQ